MKLGRKKRIKTLRKGGNPGFPGVVLFTEYNDWKDGDMAYYKTFSGETRHGTIQYFREYEKFGTVVVLIDSVKGYYQPGFAKDLMLEKPKDYKIRKSKK